MRRGPGIPRLSMAAPALAAAAGVLFYLAWEIAHRGIYLYSQNVYKVDDADEWRYVACSRLVVHGYRLFDQVFSAQPPLLFASLATGMRLFGDGIGGARWVELLFGVLALAGVGWLTCRLAGRWAAAASVVLLSVSPGFLIYYHTIEAEGPMMALAVLSLALALEAGKRVPPADLARETVTGGKRFPRGPLWWAAAAGLALAAAVLTKFFAVEVIVPGLWLLVAWSRSIRRSAPTIASYVAGAVIPVALDFLLLSPAKQWQQVIQMHERAASAPLPDLIPAHTIVWSFLTLDAGLSILAVAGMAILVLRGQWRHLVFAILWLGGSIGMLLIFRPLFPHHAAILLAPLGVVPGIGLISRPSLHPNRGRPNEPKENRLTYKIHRLRADRRVAAIVAIAALAYLGFAVRLVHDDRHALYGSGSKGSELLATYLSSHTTGSDLIVADDVRAVDLAGRLVAPPLCDPSTVRLKAGYLTAADLVDATINYRVRLVAPTTGLFAQAPGYISWLRGHYRAQKGPGGDVVYFRRSTG
jgi:Dolichyl-phosphate-mannose-protein mannosyltransferase